MKPALIPLAALALAGTFPGGPVLAAAMPGPALTASRAWSRPAVAGTNGIGYLVIANHGKAADALVGVESPVAARVDMHAMSMTGGIMKMQKVASVALPPGGEAVFGPNGGYHLMLMSLTKPLNVGDKVPATLTFKSGARLQVAFSVSVMPPNM